MPLGLGSHQARVHRELAQLDTNLLFPRTTQHENLGSSRSSPNVSSSFHMKTASSLGGALYKPAHNTDFATLFFFPFVLLSF